jgi:hypothetical protein
MSHPSERYLRAKGLTVPDLIFLFFLWFQRRLVVQKDRDMLKNDVRMPDGRFENDPTGRSDIIDPPSPVRGGRDKTVLDQ